MAIVVREFFTRWGFDADTDLVEKFKNALGAAKNTAVSAGKGLWKFATVVGFGIIKVGKMFSAIQSLKNMMLLTVAASGAISSAFFQFATNTAKAAAKSEQYAKALGLTPVGLQEWEFALGRTGGSITAFKNGIATLADAQLKSKEGSEAATEAFHKLNVPIEDLRDAKPEELFLAVSDGLRKMKNPTEMMARLIRLFGKEVAVELEGSLLKGRDALEEFKQEGHDLGLILSEEDFKNAGKFNDALGKLKNTFGGFKQLLGAKLLPVFTEVLEAKGDFSVEDRKAIVDGIVKGVRIFSKALRTALKMSKRFQVGLRGTLSVLGGLERILAVVKTALLFFITFQVVAIVSGFIVLLSGMVVVLQANTGALGLLRTAMIAFGRATYFAFIKLFVIPLIITAIIVLIVLLLEDIKIFSEGGRSAIGEFLKEFPEVEQGFENFEEFVYGWAFRLVEAFDDMGADIRRIMRNLEEDDAWSNWLDLLEKDIDRTLADLKVAFKEFALWLDDLIPKSVMSALETASEFLEGTPAAQAAGKGTGSDVIAGLANDSRRRGPGGVGNLGTQKPSVSVQGGPTTINVTQQEGESGEQFAKRVVRLQAREAKKLDTKRASIVLTPVFDR